nr:ATP-binding protein [uncultured Mediterraneibacter sp.]
MIKNKCNVPGIEKKSGEDLMENMIKIADSQRGLLWILFAVLVLAAFFWNLYRRERKKILKVESSVEEEKQFYRIFAENVQNCFIYLEKDKSTVRYVSPNFEKMTGIGADELRSDLNILRELIGHTERRLLKEQLGKWNPTKPYIQEVSYQKRGSEETRRVKISLQELEEGGYLLIFSDITNEYHLRQKALEDLKKAEKESRAKTDFLSNMSHEIRTPMNGIQGLLALARANVNDRNLMDAYLDRTEKLSQFLLTLINDILDISRIESGKMELEKEVFDLRELATRLDTMFRKTAEAKGIHWKVEMQDCRTHYVIGDEMRISQVIINFISNANKFTPSGGLVTVTFREMEVIEGAMHLMIRVRDTGKGIKEDFIDKVFHPFEQEDASTAHNYGGSGLGMAIADNIVKLMGGKILVESEEGKGTEFAVYITLPVAEEMEIAEQPVTDGIAGQSTEEKEAQRTEAIAQFSLEGLHILLAEDNDINAEVAMELLSMQGAAVERAADGADAVRRFEESEPGAYDVILMDIQMPQMNGWEATEVIRKLERADAGLPIFAMSANAFTEDQRHSLESGMNGHINKPVNYEEVRRMIGESMYARREGDRRWTNG